ncbi:MAG: hypothetical protein HQL95_10570 [Magnetococcales bacterium]|nr:hypothetical protein [Magnetococcales bacterium]
MAEMIGQALLEVNGIQSYRVNRHAGSMVVHYDTNVLTDQVVSELCQQRCLSGSSAVVEEAGKEKSSLPKAPVSAGAQLGRAIFKAFVQQTVERSVFSMVTAVLK